MIRDLNKKEAEFGVFNTKYSDDAVATLKTGSRIIGFTRGLFSLIDLIYSVLKKTGKSEVVVCTWSAGIKDANQVKWMLDSDLIESFRLLTDYSYKTRQERYAISVEALFGVENIRTTDIHAKFVLIKNELFNIVITTSMNLNANKKCELFELDDCFNKYEFISTFVNSLFTEKEEGFDNSFKKANERLNRFFKNEKEEHKKNDIKGWYKKV